MKSFQAEYLHTLPISHRLLTTIRQIGEYKGKQQLYQQQAPEVLENRIGVRDGLNSDAMKK